MFAFLYLSGLTYAATAILAAHELVQGTIGDVGPELAAMVIAATATGLYGFLERLDGVGEASQ